MAWFGGGRDEFVNRRRSPSRDQILLVNSRLGGTRHVQMQRAGAVGVIACAVAVAGWVAIRGAGSMTHSLLAENPRFEIRRLEFRSSGRLSPDHLRQYAAVSEGLNLFAIDLAGIRDRLERVPLIGRAEVQRQLPDGLVVQVEERIPLARVQTKGGQALPVDRDGHILSPLHVPQLPMLTGAGDRGVAPGSVLREPATRDGLALLTVLEDARLAFEIPLVQVDVGDPAQLVLKMKAGGQVLMGRDQLDRRVSELAAIVKQSDERDADIEFADLTVDRNPPVRFKARAPEAGAPPVLRPNQPPAAVPNRPARRHG